MCIYTGDNTLILRETMKDLEKAPRSAPLPARPSLDDRQSRPRQAGQAAHQWRMLPGCSVKVSRSARAVKVTVIGPIAQTWSRGEVSPLR
jgi:hypothetical protein